MSGIDRALRSILVALSLSVLVTGSLAVFLTLARSGPEGNVDVGPTVTSTRSPESHIAYVSDQEGEAAIYVMDADGSNRRRISGDDQGFCIFPSWSPDGKHLAFLELSERAGASIWVTDLDGSTPVSVSHPLANGPSQDVDTIPPAWSLEGTQVAFVTLGDLSGTALQIARLEGAGIDHTIPLTGYEAWALRRSPVDDRLLLVGQHQGGASNVYTVSAQSEGPTLIMTGTTAADWSPNGEQIAVGERASRSVLVLDGDGEPRPVAQFSTTPTGVRWSPDGRLMAVVGAGSERQGYYDALYVVDVEDGEITPLVDGEAWVDWPQWSSDGERLLFTQGPLIRRSGLPYGNLWVYDTASGDMDQLTTGQGFDGLGTWSP
jgi:Tol biopolymer transport system component